MKIKAADILKLLEQKYPVEKYLSVAECKIGSSWFMNRCSRFDMWVMARSWAHPRFIGCEIKVNRHDFLNDNKWRAYLPYCTEFYFVSPPDIIDPKEIPEQAGLMICTKNGKRLITKKKAPVREVEIPQSVLLYILMCRTRIVNQSGKRSKVELWTDRLKEMKGNKKLGHEVAYCIREQADRKIKDVLEENKKLREENKGLQKIKEYLDKKGVTDEAIKAATRYDADQLLREALSGIPYNLPSFLEDIEQKAGLALKALAPKFQRRLF